MITQSIRTSKYTTTIDIPAQKLHTKAKFIQIAKSPSHLREQTITIPNQCYETEQQNKRFTLETKLMIEELEQAYNEDVQALQEQINSMKMSHEIEKLKLQNQLNSQRRELQVVRKQFEHSESISNNSQIQKDSLLSQLQIEVKSKDRVIESKSRQLESLVNEVKEVKKQLNEKNALVITKFREIQTEKDKSYREEKKVLQQMIEIARKEKQTIQSQLSSELHRVRDESRRQLISIQSLQRQNVSLREQLTESRKQLEFQTSEIDSYIKSLKQLEQQKALLQENNMNLHQKIQQQNSNIEKMLQEMRQQTIYVEKLHAEAGISLGGPTLRTTDRALQDELTLMRVKLDQYSRTLYSKDIQITQKQTNYLMKLKEIDTQKLNTQKTLEQLSQAQTQITSLNQQISQLQKSHQHLKTQLTTKIVQYNELLSRPPEHYEVKIQKTIDKKDYIDNLEAKVTELEAIIDQLREDNSSYIEEIRKKVKENQLIKVREQSLIKTNEELKDYISNKEKSLGWAVEREIMKDVSLSQEGSSEKPSGYKVFVRHSGSQSSSSNSNLQVSGIQAGNAINFSLESKIQSIFDKSQSKSKIHIERQSFSRQNQSLNQSNQNLNRQKDDQEE